jgi:hypothetical protein
MSVCGTEYRNSWTSVPELDLALQRVITLAEDDHD